MTAFTNFVLTLPAGHAGCFKQTCSAHLSGIHDFSFNPGLGFWAFVVSRTGQIGTFAKQTLVSAPTRWLAGGSARLCGLLRQSIHLVLH